LQAASRKDIQGRDGKKLYQFDKAVFSGADRESVKGERQGGGIRMLLMGKIKSPV
jgi:hypothetical protein